MSTHRRRDAPKRDPAPLPARPYGRVGHPGQAVVQTPRLARPGRTHPSRASNLLVETLPRTGPGRRFGVPSPGDDRRCERADWQGSRARWTQSSPCGRQPRRSVHFPLRPGYSGPRPWTESPRSQRTSSAAPRRHVPTTIPIGADLAQDPCSSSADGWPGAWCGPGGGPFRDRRGNLPELGVLESPSDPGTPLLRVAPGPGRPQAAGA